MASSASHHVLITGAAGNLGSKLTAHALSAPWCATVTTLDLAGATGDPGPGPSAAPAAAGTARLRRLQADLRQAPEAGWGAALEGVDTVWHLAAQHPYPDASWDDVAASIDMTLHLLSAARAAGVRRLVLTSSNHMMGGWKDGPLHPGMLNADTPVRPGTRFRETEGRVFDSTPYAAAKLMNERACLAAAREGLEVVVVRIGWCRPGENLPQEIGLAVIPGVDMQQGADATALQDLRWVRDMWLSNADLCHLFERCTLADAAAWPAPGIIVNGTSANRDSVWSTHEAREWLGFQAQDDLYRHLAA